MFTGLIEDIGTVSRLDGSAGGLTLRIETAMPLDGMKIGESICCDGACLTVVEKAEGRFGADLSFETLQRTTWQSARVGRRVNLERALRPGDRLDGHIVSGHVDGVGKLARRVERASALELFFKCGPELLRYVVPKGSIAVDGISLTVNEANRDGFSVVLVPHTRKRTTLGEKRAGAEVNLECDIIGKYVERLITKDGRIDRAFLAEHGFLK